MPFYGQTWFLSIMSGLIAVFLCHVFGLPLDKYGATNGQSDVSDDTKEGASTLGDRQALVHARTKSYIGVFLTVAVLVYGSFLIAQSTGSCRLIDVQPDIQTGGRPPF